MASSELRHKERPEAVRDDSEYGCAINWFAVRLESLLRIKYLISAKFSLCVKLTVSAQFEKVQYTFLFSVGVSTERAMKKLIAQVELLQLKRPKKLAIALS